MPDLSPTDVAVGNSHATSPLTVHFRPFGIFSRLLALAVIFAGELLVLSLIADGNNLANRGTLLEVLAAWGPWILRGIVGFAALFVTFGYLKNKAAFEAISRRVEITPLTKPLLFAHFSAIALTGILTFVLYSGNVSGIPADFVASGWLIAGAGAILFAGFAFVPPAAWIEMVRSTRYLWLSASLAVAGASLVGSASRSLWQPIAGVTFRLVAAMLRLFFSGVIADPKTMSIGTRNFQVEIAQECSGLEGVGLILAFSIVWLWLFRKECRFPQSFLLVPAGMVVAYLLNSARIWALIVIGGAGASEIALKGFHSQAGWIAFNIVALGFSIVARRTPYFALNPRAKPLVQSAENPTAAYLVPFLAILAAGMVSSAMSATFEWPYPLRFLAAAGTLWLFRAKYANLQWRAGWAGCAIGTIAFFIWIAADRLIGSQVTNTMPDALASSSAAARIIWISFRILAPVITVPIAEELAFRGFLLRRLASQDFESISFSRISWFALLISSAAFGALHGRQWVAGVAVGLLYAFALMRRGRIGDAVAAHATTNGLLAVYVLVFGQWHLW